MTFGFLTFPKIFRQRALSSESFGEFAAKTHIRWYENAKLCIFEACLPVTLRRLFKNLSVWDPETAAVDKGCVEQRFSSVPSPISPSPIHSIPQLSKHRRGAVLFPWQRFPFPDLCVLLEQPVSPRKQQDDPAHSCVFCALGSVLSCFLKRL